LVFATLHTTGAEGTCNRIIDAFPVEQQEQVRVQLSVSILAVISQQLIRRADGSGRIAAFEFMVTTPAVRNLIRENKTYNIDSHIQTGKRYGMSLLDTHLFELYERGIVLAEDALLKARKARDLEQKIRQFEASHGRVYTATIAGEEAEMGLDMTELQAPGS
jgi:twitching motility protein PilT